MDPDLEVALGTIALTICMSALVLWAVTRYIDPIERWLEGCRRFFSRIVDRWSREGKLRQEIRQRAARMTKNETTGHKKRR